MRSEDEIRNVLRHLDEESDDPAESCTQGDTFKYGYLIGKLEALAWVLGDNNLANVKNHYDFEDYRRELES